MELRLATTVGHQELVNKGEGLFCLGTLVNQLEHLIKHIVNNLEHVTIDGASR